MIEAYLEELEAELEVVGIRGRLQRRILVETEDHLRSDPEWAEHFGAPALVADRFADELATTGTRRAAASVFAALALVGLGYALIFGLANRGADIFAGSTWQIAVSLSAGALVLLAPQLALVAGSLAALRAWRRRGADVMPAEEVRRLRRQTAIALVSGMVAVGALVVFSLTKGDRAIAWGAAAILLLPLGWAGLRFARFARLEPRAVGAPGDAYDDLGPLVRLRSRPWMFCALGAVAAAAVTFAAGAYGGKLDEGLWNGAWEAFWVYAGFWVFGPSLGLRSTR